MEKQLRGPDLLCAAVNQILAHPETWNQSQWHCGTAHCIFGHCEMLAGGPTENTYDNVKAMLGLPPSDAAYLSRAQRTLPEIYQFAKIYRDGWDRDGWDRAGWDRAGFNRDGWDRAGWDRDGFNRDGWDRDGEKLDMVPFDLAIPAIT